MWLQSYRKCLDYHRLASAPERRQDRSGSSCSSCSAQAHNADTFISREYRLLSLSSQCAHVNDVSRSILRQKHQRETCLNTESSKV